MAKLVFCDTRLPQRTFELSSEKTTVGRGRHNRLIIEDTSVSTDHCEILVYGPEVIIREHGSKNGTFVDGQRIQGQVPAHSGQIIRFGQVETRLELGPEDQFPDDSVTSWTAVHLEARLKKRAQKQIDPEEPVASQPLLNPEDAGRETVILRAETRDPVLTESVMHKGPVPSDTANRMMRWRVSVLLAGVITGIGLLLVRCS